jgi:hypothetical protein
MGKAQPVYPKGLTFEQVWTSIMELKEIQKKTDLQIEEAARIVKENARRQAETDRQMQETDRQMKETDRQMKEYNKRFGEFTNRFGEIVEYMVAPNLREKFRELGLNFPKANPDQDISDTEHNIYLEVDVILENGDKAILVETKTKPVAGDVRDHVKRLEKMRRYADLHGDKRKFLGAIAGVVMTKSIKQNILKQGFFAIEPSGETFNIIPPQGQPREW